MSRAGRMLGLMAMLLGSLSVRAAITVWQSGQALLPVVVDAGAPAEERAAAQELARVLGVMSGLAWPVLEGNHAGPAFRVGGSRAWPDAGPMKLSADILAPAPGESGPDAFRIRTEAGGVFIEAATPEATGFAVAWFLQATAGVRWYAPGALGEVIPRRAEWILPDMNLSVEPAFVSREIHGAETAEGTEWARRNGLRRRLDYSHALGSVFPGETLAAHPDWLPLVRGKRTPPADHNDRQWQPNLALPEVAAHAAEVAIRAFARDPGRQSFSLGVNDSLRYDESAATQALVSPLGYHRGMPDYSPLIFSFMNRVAETLARSHPNRYLGCLAYQWGENAPAFGMHPQVMPYVTTDRTQYYDPAYREADLALMTRWRNSGVRAFGLWEYAFGQGFLVPREMPAALSEGIREGWRRGARGYMAEVEAHPGFDTFKAWMLARLLWEPERTWQELADDFSPGYYGRSAAPMRAFFAGCATRWMGQGGAPHWLKYYQQEDQALLFPPEICRELRGQLAEALRLADTPEVAARVEQTSRAFAVTEAYVTMDEVRRELQLRSTLTLEDLPALAAQVRRYLQALADFRVAYDKAREGDVPAMAKMKLGTLLENDPVPRLLWLLGLHDSQAPQRLLQEAGSGAASTESWRHLAGAIASGRLATAPDLVANGSFRETDPTGLVPRFLHPLTDEIPAGWEWRVVPTQHGRVGLRGLEGGQPFLRIEGAWDTQFFQWLPVVPGNVYVATARLRGRSAPGGDAALYFTFLSASGEIVGAPRMQSLPKGSDTGWRTMALGDLVPEGAVWVGVGCTASRQAAGDWLEVSSIALQEVGITQPAP